MVRHDGGGEDERERSAQIASAEAGGGEPVGISPLGDPRQQAAGEDLGHVEADGGDHDRRRDCEPGGRRHGGEAEAGPRPDGRRDQEPAFVAVRAIGVGGEKRCEQCRREHGGGEDPRPHDASGHTPRGIGEHDPLDIRHDERDQDRRKRAPSPVEEDPGDGGAAIGGMS